MSAAPAAASRGANFAVAAVLASFVAGVYTYTVRTTGSADDGLERALERAAAEPPSRTRVESRCFKSELRTFGFLR
jgi:hypothetical protein